MILEQARIAQSSELPIDHAGRAMVFIRSSPPPVVRRSHEQKNLHGYRCERLGHNQCDAESLEARYNGFIMRWASEPREAQGTICNLEPAHEIGSTRQGQVNDCNRSDNIIAVVQYNIFEGRRSDDPYGTRSIEHHIAQLQFHVGRALDVDLEREGLLLVRLVLSIVDQADKVDIGQAIEAHIDMLGLEADTREGLWAKEEAELELDVHTSFKRHSLGMWSD